MNRRTLTGTTLVVLGLLFIAAVVLSAALLRGLRLDLTENRLYTLSEGTRAIVERLEEPVQLTFYFSEHVTGDIPQLRTYANRVRELLEEIAAASRGKVRLEVIDPQPFSEEEDRATAFGLQAVPLGQGAGSLFFGLAGSNSTDGQMAIPFFQPDKEAFLEYDVAKLISGLSGEAKPVVGVISTLDIGPGFDPAARRVTEGVVVYEEMRNLFDVKRLEPNVTQIDDELQMLMLVHPKGLSADTLYAIDQFVLRGGRLLVFVDPHAEMEQAGQGTDPTQAMFESKSSDLKELFAAWGCAVRAADPGPAGSTAGAPPWHPRARRRAAQSGRCCFGATQRGEPVVGRPLPSCRRRQYHAGCAGAKFRKRDDRRQRADSLPARSGTAIRRLQPYRRSLRDRGATERSGEDRFP
jgi:ABC-type uncharacterized transport system involved in gliding motility auxiliary subunit